MKILILNTHSILNSGDAAIVFSQIRFLQRVFHDPEITLVSRTPKLDQKLYTPMGIKTLPPIIPAPSVFSGWLNQFQESVKNILAWGSKSALLREMIACDVVLASGGGYFWSNRRHMPGPMFLQNLLPVALAGALKKPLVFLPQSFGPLLNPTAEALLRKALSAPSVVKIFAREAQSHAYVTQLLKEETAASKVEIAPDMAFLFDLEQKTAASASLSLEALARLEDSPRPQAVVTLRQWDFPEAQDAAGKRKKQRDYLDAMTEICLGFHDRFQGSILILPQVKGPGNFEDDRIISSELRDRLDSHIPAAALPALDLEEAAGPAVAQACIAQAEIVIATRFHSGIFALNADVPLFSVGYQPKSHETLRQLGLQAYSMPIESIEPDRVLDALDILLNRSPEQKAAIHDRIQKMRQELTGKLEAILLPFRQD